MSSATRPRVKIFFVTRRADHAELVSSSIGPRDHFMRLDTIEELRFHLTTPTIDWTPCLVIISRQVMAEPPAPLSGVMRRAGFCTWALLWDRKGRMEDDELMQDERTLDRFDLIWEAPPTALRLRHATGLAQQRFQSFRQLIDIIPSAMIFADAMGQEILCANEAARHVLKRDPEGAQLQDLFELPADALQEARWRGNARLKRTPRPTILGLSAHSVYDEQVHLLLFRDMTEELLREHEQEEARRLLMLGKMVSVLTHELGNPLAAMKTTLQVLERNHGRFDDQKISDYIRRVILEINRLDNTVRDFLTFARDAPLLLGEVSLADIVRRTQDDMRLWCEEHRITLTVEPIAPAADLVVGELFRLKQILVNLIVNALEAILATGRGSGLITLRATLDEDEERVRVEVEDDGEGLAPEVQAQIFEAFFTTKGSGTGLGLTICRQLAELLDGDLELRNRADHQGARAVLTLKRAPSQLA